MRTTGSRGAGAYRPRQRAGALGLNLEKPTRQADASKRLIFSFGELPEVREALRQRDEVRAAVAESLAQEPLGTQVERLRDDILKMLRKLNDDEAGR